MKESRTASVNGSILIISCTTTRCIHLEFCLMMATCITANDILYPHGQSSVTQFKSDKEDNGRDIFKVVQNRVNVFWDSWLKNIPPQLLSRNKWFPQRSNLEIGYFVIVVEKGIKANYIRDLFTNYV